MFGRGSSGTYYIHSGFTMAEVLIVMGLIGVVAAVSMAFLRPREGLVKSTDATRVHNAREMANGTAQYFLVNNEDFKDGEIPEGKAFAVPVCAEGVTDGNCISLDELVPSYIGHIPQDPVEPCINFSGYITYVADSGEVKVDAVHYGKLKGDTGIVVYPGCIPDEDTIVNTHKYDFTHTVYRWGTNIAINKNNMPVIGHNGRLPYHTDHTHSYGSLYPLITACQDLVCDSYSSVEAHSPFKTTSENVGKDMSMIIAANGYPAHSYISVTDSYSIMFTRCLDELCSSLQTSVVDTNGSFTMNKLILGADGLPIIAYYKPNNGLYVTRCLDAWCGSTTKTRVSTPSEDGNLSSFALALGTDGYPIIAAHNSSYISVGLRIIKCSNLDCSASLTKTTIADSLYMSSSSIDIAVGADGLPIISYEQAYNSYYETNPKLQLVHCTTHDCAGAVTLSSVASIGQVSSGNGRTALAIGDDGNPVIVHYYLDGVSSDRLAVTKCYDPTCTSSLLTPIPGTTSNWYGIDPDIAIDATGRPVIVYAGFSHSPGFYRCANKDCAL